jgi:tetratricopeptide (TPR) repeat protein
MLNAPMLKRRRNYRIGWYVFLTIWFFFLNSRCSYGQSFVSVVDSTYKSGLNYFAKSEFDSAIFCFCSSSRLYFKQGDGISFIASEIKRAHTYGKLEQFENAQIILDSVANNPDFEKVKQSALIAEYFHVLGTIYGDQGNNSKGIELLLISDSLREKFLGPKDTLRSNTLNNIGTYYLYLGNVDSAEVFYKAALEIAINNRLNQENPDIGMYFQNLGIIYAIQGHFDKALELFTRGLELNEKVFKKNSVSLADLYINLGRLNYLLSRNVKAAFYFSKAEAIFKLKLEDDAIPIGGLNVNKGNLFYRDGDLHKALEYYKNAYYIYKSKIQGDHQKISAVLNNIGSIYSQLGEYEKSLQYYKESLEISKNKSSKTMLFRNLAKVYQDQGEYEQANAYFLKSIEYAHENLTKFHYELGNSYLDYGDFFVGSREFERGI